MEYDYDIQWVGRTISIRGNLRGRGLRQICTGIHQIIEKESYPAVVLDFSRCDRITEGVMLPLIPVIGKYRESGIEFALILPKDEALNRLFKNANWAHHINPNEHKQAEHHGGHVPALRFNDMASTAGIIDEIMDLIIGKLDTDRETLKAVEWSLCEIMDNVSNHAQSPVGGFVQATAYKHSNHVEFVVADAGIGIPQSMGIPKHEVALRQVINEGITRDRTKNAGNGLYGSYRVATLSEGQFEINSFEGLLFCTKERTGSRRIHQLYPGTSVRCSIGLNDKELLGKALQFKEGPHDPPYDYIERRYETDGGEMILVVKDEARLDIGSRQGGMRIRSIIENLLQSRVPVILDFDGIGVISSSFADEVFGRLFLDMGPRSFMTRIEIRNVDPTVEGLIDRAIMQRAQLGNGDI